MANFFAENMYILLKYNSLVNCPLLLMCSGSKLLMSHWKLLRNKHFQKVHYAKAGDNF